MADSTSEFTVRGPLPIDEADQDSSTAVIRLCVFLNVLNTLHSQLRAALQAKATSQFDAHIARGHQCVAFLLLIGVLKEGADALRHFQARLDLLVHRLDRELPEGDELTAAWARLSAAIDKRDPHSLWCRVLKRVRDDAAFHWSMGQLQEVCTRYSGRDCHLAIYRDGLPEESVRFPVADEMLAEIAFGNNGGEWISSCMAEIGRFAHDVDIVLSKALPLTFRDSGASLELAEAPHPPTTEPLA